MWQIFTILLRQQFSRVLFGHLPRLFKSVIIRALRDGSTLYISPALAFIYSYNYNEHNCTCRNTYARWNSSKTEIYDPIVLVAP